MSQNEYARHLAALAGGEPQLLSHAKAALAAGDYQWALELAEQLLQLSSSDRKAGEIRAASLRALGEKQVAATARNYYLTQALEAEHKIAIGMMKNMDKQIVHDISPSQRSLPAWPSS